MARKPRAVATPAQEVIEDIQIEDELKHAYLDYSMSVITGRALPDARDGLKPVQRRILYAMIENGYRADKPHRKSARVIGDVMGKYHPHGDASIYEAMLRMSRYWSMRIPLIDGQGNIGSIDNDPSAAMRYCVTADTRIMTRDGMVPIGTLSNGDETTIETEIVSYDAKTNPVYKIFNSGIHDVYHLKTQEGFEIKGSANHPLMVLEQHDGYPVIGWKFIENISSKDMVVIQRNTPNLSNKDTYAESFIAGCLVSEGSVTENRITFCNTNKAYFDAFVSAYSEVVGNKYYTSVRLLESGKKIYEFDVQETSEFMGTILSEMNGLYSAQKRIPEFVWASNERSQQVFLQALFEGDGSVSKLAKNTITLTYSTISKQLAHDVQLMLLNFGIIAKQSQSSRDEIKCFISNLSTAKLFMKRVGFYDVKQKYLENIIEELEIARSGKSLTRDRIPFLNGIKQNGVHGHKEKLKKSNIDTYERINMNYTDIYSMLDPFGAAVFEHYANLGFYYATVASCDLVGQEEIFSPKVESACHSYFGNGFVNHNTESRLDEFATCLLRDINKNTVDWQPNYDDTVMEPSVLPAEFPHLLVNGAGGIAVGMATNIPTHNLNEVIDATIHMIENPDATLGDLLKICKGPDFPTGGLITNPLDIPTIYETGRGAITMRSKVEIEQITRARKGIVITELPYQVVKSNVIKKIVSLVTPSKEGGGKRIDGINDVRDESDRDGIRIVVELRGNVDADKILDQLFKLTDLECNFGVNMLALKHGRPENMPFRDVIEHFIEFRKDVVSRRAQFDLDNTRRRGRVLLALAVAVANLDPVIEIIRASSNPAEAREGLMKNPWPAKHVEKFLEMVDPEAKMRYGKYSLSEEQAQAILDLRLHRLTGLEREKIESDLAELVKTIKQLLAILKSKKKLHGVIVSELEEIKKNFGTKRLTKFVK